MTQCQTDASLVSITFSRDRWTPLIDGIRMNSDIARQILDRLSHAYGDAGAAHPWFALWQAHCARHFDLEAADALLAKNINCQPGARLFLAHSYGKIVLAELVALAVSRAGTEIRAASLYDWVDCTGSADLAALRRDLHGIIAAAVDPARLDAIACSGILAAIYQEIFPPALRHLLGEYYTPSWLVDYCIDRALRHHPGTADPLTILDPAAGSGSFLAHCISRLGAARLPARVNIVGFDVNPLAVDFCRANAMLAAAKSGETGHEPRFDIRIHLADAVCDPAPDAAQAMPACRLPAATRKSFLATLQQCAADAAAATRPVGAHVIVGNPPWIAWDGLTRRYRDSLAPQWAASTLMVNTGWRAKVAAGKTDFSSLFVYLAAERHAAANAVMVFVLPLSLFQSHLSGAGFRTFRTAGGRPFALVEIDDFSGVKVFADAVNRTSAGTFIVDKAQHFPIRYAIWSHACDGGGERLMCVPSLGGPLVEQAANAPIVAFGPGRARLETAAGRSDYRARGGVNTGGANTILWLDVLARGDSFCDVRNIGTSRRGSNPVIAAEVESDAVWPLLRGADMRRWQATPSKSILLLYSPDQPKKALPVDSARQLLPRAYAFASQFREQLGGRKEYHRWGGAGPFYEVYRIGPYTFSPVKVAWRHTGYRKALNVSVVDDRGRRPAIPDQKVILIPFDDVTEAHYVCAVLSSSVTAVLLDRYLGADASTHILDYVALRKFAADDGDHQRLAALSVAAHQAAAAGEEVAPFETEIDAVVARLRRVQDL
jgi:hypothetical protein